MSATVRVEFRKWDGRPHWTYDAIRLGEDAHGIWLGCPSGSELDRPGLHLRFEFPSVVLFPRRQWWAAAFNADADPARRAGCEVYIDMATVAEWDGDRVRAVDLDLDVVRRWDSRVELLDEDEFDEHRAALGYPAEVVAAARASAAACRAALEAGAEPFVDTFRGWLAQVD